jgi:hypothetical protein
MTNEIPYTTSCELLAKKTVTRLVNEGLIPAVFSAELLKMLSDGRPRPEDWQLLVEKTIEIEEKRALDGNNEETH